MKNVLAINSIFKLILKHKYYYIITFVLTCVFTLMHASSVKKKYETFIYVHISPTYYAVKSPTYHAVKPPAYLKEDKSFRVYLKLFEERFFDKKKLISFFGLDYYNNIFKTTKDANIVFRNNDFLKIDVADNFIKIFIDSNDLKFIQIFTNYLNRLNFELTKEIIEIEAYSQIDMQDVVDNKNLNLNPDLVALIKEQKREAKLKKYILDNNLQLFLIDNPTEPKLIYPIITQLFINYFLVLNVILFLFLKERKKNIKEKFDQ